MINTLTQMVNSQVSNIVALNPERGLRSFGVEHSHILIAQGLQLREEARLSPVF